MAEPMQTEAGQQRGGAQEPEAAVRCRPGAQQRADDGHEQAEHRHHVVAARLEQRSNRIHRVDGTAPRYLVINMTLRGTIEEGILKMVEAKADLAAHEQDLTQQVTQTYFKTQLAMQLLRLQEESLKALEARDQSVDVKTGATLNRAERLQLRMGIEHIIVAEASPGQLEDEFRLSFSHANRLPHHHDRAGGQRGEKRHDRHHGDQRAAGAILSGTVLLVLGSMTIALVLGVGAAIYLNEYARDGRFIELIGFYNNFYFKTN